MNEKNGYFCSALLISADAAEDVRAAEELNLRLMRFRLPANLRKNLPKDRQRVNSRYLREAELRMALQERSAEELGECLEETGWLVVICSPRLLRSSACMETIRMFKEARGQDRTLAVLLEGEPADSFPKELCFREVTVSAENGELRRVTEEVEPLAADIRKTAAGSQGQLLDDAVMRLAAPLFGLNYDDLRQRHREQRLRRIAVFCGAAAGAGFLIGMSCLFLSFRVNAQKKVIESQQEELEVQYAAQRKKYEESMVNVAGELLGQGRQMDALYALRSTLPEDAAEAAEVCPAEVQRVLSGALGIYAPGMLVPVERVPLETVREYFPSEEELRSFSSLTRWLVGRKILFAEQWSSHWGTLITDQSEVYDYYAGLLNDGEMELFEHTGMLFAAPPKRRAVAAALRDSDLYLQFEGEEEVTCYRSVDAEDLEQGQRITMKEWQELMYSGDKNVMDGTLVSSDGKYKVLFEGGSSEGTLFFYRKGETEPVRRLYPEGGIARSMKKMKNREGYLLLGPSYAWILNEDLEVTAEILVPEYQVNDYNPGIEYRVLDYDPGKDALLLSGEFEPLDETYDTCWLPLRSAEELILETDRRLGNYVPSEEIMSRYGIM